MATLIIGAGALAREVVAVLQANKQPIAGLVVEPGYPVEEVSGLPVIVGLQRAREARSTLIVAIGDGAVRQRLASELGGLVFDVAMHPAASLGPRVGIGQGSMIIGPMSATTDVMIGDHVLVNPGCLIAHDCQVGSFATLGPGVILTGGVTVGEGAFLGAGAVVTPGLTIGPRAVVGAGAVVLRDVPAGATVVGVPARSIGGGS